MSNQSILRLQREFAQFERQPDYQIYIAYNDERINVARALIVGPPDTPHGY
jgi:ubiquitin-protein ligase